MLTTIRHLLEMIRFSHTLFALPFALLAALMAWRTPSPEGGLPAFQWEHLLGILVCMIGARSAAMAFNRMADRFIDAGNPRTITRHLPAGLLSTTTVTLFIIVSVAVFVAGTWVFLPNPWPVRLAIPVLLFLLGYSYAKRFTALAHFWLGIALMLAPVCAWIALRGQWLTTHPQDILPAVLLGTAVLAWVSGFDIIYACQDADFDRAAKLHSVPARLGVANALRLAAGCHCVAVMLFAAVLWCPAVPLGWVFGSGVLAVAGLLIYEHSLVKSTDLTRVNIAFFNVNAVISLGLLVLGAIDLFT